MRGGEGRGLLLEADGEEIGKNIIFAEMVTAEAEAARPHKSRETTHTH